MADIETAGEYVHEPVMPDEILTAFDLKPGQVVVDCTLGLGGHTTRFIEAVGPDGTVLGLDWDESMLATARRRLGEPSTVRLITRHVDFRGLRRVA